MEVVPRVDSENGIPARAAACAPAISPSVCINRVKPVGAIPKGCATRSPSTVAPGVDLGDIAQDRRVKFDVAERLSGPRERQLLFGGTIGVVERRLGRAALGDAAQIVDRQRGIEPTPRRTQLRLAELHKGCQFARSGQAALHQDRRSVLGGGQRPPQACPALFDGTAEVLQQQRFL